jgi:hypothetical protein
MRRTRESSPTAEAAPMGKRSAGSLTQLGGDQGARSTEGAHVLASSSWLQHCVVVVYMPRRTSRHCSCAASITEADWGERGPPDLCCEWVGRGASQEGLAHSGSMGVRCTPQYYSVLQCLARLRLGWHQLQIWTDRIKKARARMPRNQRLCRLCSTDGAAFRAHRAGGGCVEDVQHFVLECPA